MKVIVIGAGLIGLLTARELARAGCEVLVLDQSTPGRESSWAGGGILSPLYPWRYADAVNVLAAWGQQHYAQLAEELQEEGGIDPQWTKSGLIVLDGNGHEAAPFAEKFAMRMAVIDSRTVHQLESEIDVPTQHALYFPDIAQVRNPRLVKSLMTSCLNLGIDIRSNARVLELVREGSRVTGIISNQGGQDADCVVVAGGAWSGHLLQESALELPVFPVKGQMILFRASPGLMTHIVLYQGHYLIPRRYGRILAGSTLEQTGFDNTTTTEGYQQLHEFATDLCPGLLDCPVEGHWAGLRPGQQGDIPYICAVPDYDGLYLNTGHYRNGVVLGPASARLAADLILAREPCCDPEPYSLNREED